MVDELMSDNWEIAEVLCFVMLFSNVMRLRSFSAPLCVLSCSFPLGTACPAGQVEQNEAECLTFVATVARVCRLIEAKQFVTPTKSFCQP